MINAYRFFKYTVIYEFLNTHYSFHCRSGGCQLAVFKIHTMPETVDKQVSYHQQPVFPQKKPPMVCSQHISTNIPSNNGEVAGMAKKSFGVEEFLTISKEEVLPSSTVVVVVLVGTELRDSNFEMAFLKLLPGGDCEPLPESDVDLGVDSNLALPGVEIGW